MTKTAHLNMEKDEKKPVVSHKETQLRGFNIYQDYTLQDDNLIHEKILPINLLILTNK